MARPAGSPASARVRQRSAVEGRLGWTVSRHASVGSRKEGQGSALDPQEGSGPLAGPGAKPLVGVQGAKPPGGVRGSAPAKPLRCHKFSAFAAASAAATNGAGIKKKNVVNSAAAPATTESAAGRASNGASAASK